MLSTLPKIVQRIPWKLSAEGSTGADNLVIFFTNDKGWVGLRNFAVQKQTIYFFSCSDDAQPTLFIELVIKQYFLSNFLERIMSENFNEEYVTPLYPNSIDGVYTSLYFSTLSLSMIVQEFEILSWKIQTVLSELWAVILMMMNCSADKNTRTLKRTQELHYW